jgi:hypothetical protein
MEPVLGLLFAGLVFLISRSLTDKPAPLGLR